MKEKVRRARAGKKGKVPILCLGLLLLLSCEGKVSDRDGSEQAGQREEYSQEVRKILYVNSYHKGYDWSDSIERGVQKALKTAPFPIDLKIIRMDTKYIDNLDLIEERALQVKEQIEQWDPHVVIGSDDNFSRYVIVPYFMDSAVPIIFCGINWDAKEYGFPTENVTGMIEIDPIPETVELLRNFSPGEKFGILGYNGISEQKIVRNLESQLNFQAEKTALVEDFDIWKREFLAMQNQVDMLIMLNPVGMRNWDRDLARDFLLENNRIPTGTIDVSTMPFAMMGRCKIAEEQGWWAGNTALDVLKGRAIRDIPVQYNKNSLVYFNMEMINRAGFHPPAKLLQDAVLWEYQGE